MIYQEFTNINNYVLIFNITIGVFIGVTISHVAANVFSKLLSNLSSYIIKFILRLFPVSFSVSFIDRKEILDAQKYIKNYKLPMYEGVTFGTNGTSHGVDLLIQIHTKISPKLHQYAFGNQQVRIIVNDFGEKLGIQQLPTFPEKIKRYILFDGVLIPKTPRHFNLHIRPLEKLKEYPISIQFLWGNKSINDKLTIGFEEIK